eukprot:TRINITY_DN15085_c0_g2_i1.p1 TRINITY_DN15085_c0_g2~~TRINITY_DN15085_c0_g2_i1.p1  ORF type:complete len:293 (+),score=30.66 TRINITY_DN15085_c0_g2_i1:58-879(+)
MATFWTANDGTPAASAYGDSGVDIASTAKTIGVSKTRGFATFTYALLTLVVLFAPYFAFQKKLLPHQVMSLVGHIYFWPTFPLTIFLSWRRGKGLWCHVDDTVLLGVAPVSWLGIPYQLQSLGVGGVVNMAAEYGGPVTIFRTFEIDQLHLPTVDHYEPTLADLKKAVAYIDEHRKRGSRVYVHCKAGHGRGAAVAFAWLAYTRGISEEAELEELNRELSAKRHVRKTLFKQPNLRQFASELRAGELKLTYGESADDSGGRQRKRHKAEHAEF